MLHKLMKIYRRTGRAVEKKNPERNREDIGNKNGAENDVNDRIREKERERTILKDRTAAWNVPIAFMQYLKRGEDFITPEGEIVANELLTVAPPPARSFAYMTDTLFRERFADYVRGVDLLYHEATYMNADAVLAKESYHSTTGQAARIAELAGVGKLLLGHFSARYTECSELLAEAREVFPNTFLCSDGDLFEVPAVKRRS